jgi:hypothetical protein
MKHERVNCECGKEISTDAGARSVHERGAWHLAWAGGRQEEAVQEVREEGVLKAGDHVRRRGKEYVIVKTNGVGLTLYEPRYGHTFETGWTGWYAWPVEILQAYGSASAGMDAVDRINGNADRIDHRQTVRASFRRFIESPSGREAQTRAAKRRLAMRERAAAKATIDSKAEAVVE